MGRARFGHGLLARAVHGALLLAATASVGAAPIEFTPYVSAAIGFIDNIEMNPDGRQQTDDWVAEAEAGFSSRYLGRRASAGLNYRFRYLDYFDADQFDSSFHSLDASGQVVVVPDWLSVQGGAFYTQALIDPSGSPSFGNYFTPGNIRDVWGWNVSPVVIHDFGRVTLDARYTYGEVKYTDADRVSGGLAEDSSSESAQVSLANSNPQDRLSWRGFYQTSETRYENFLPYRYDRAGIELGWAVGRDWRALGEYGLESDLTADLVRGGLDSAYWYVGAVYEPDERNRVEARVGERFWGDSYFLSLQHRARLLTFRASYSELPTTTTNRFIEPPDRPPPGDIPDFPDFPGFDDPRAEPFLLKLASASVTYDAQRTTVNLSYTDSDEEYFRTGREIESRVAGFSVTRQLSSRSSMRVWYARRDRDEDPGSASTDDVYAARLTRELGRDFSASLETAYQIRRPDGGERAEGWWIGLRARKDF